MKTRRDDPGSEIAKLTPCSSPSLLLFLSKTDKSSIKFLRQIVDSLFDINTFNVFKEVLSMYRVDQNISSLLNSDLYSTFTNSDRLTMIDYLKIKTLINKQLVLNHHTLNIKQSCGVFFVLLLCFS